MKAQWFIVSAVIVVGFLFFISYTFSLFSRKPIKDIDEDYYFMNLIFFKNQTQSMEGDKTYANYYIVSRLKMHGIYVNETTFATDKLVIRYDNK